MPALKTIVVQVRERIAVLTINRLPVRNALDADTIALFGSALERLSQRNDVGVVIVTGKGDRAFAAGADLRQLRDRRRDDALTSMSARLFSAVERFPKVTIAAVNGHALGGGCELALACDLRVASAHARFGQPEVSLGIVPAAGAMQRLPRIIGLGRAKQMVLTGETIDARTALAWGLVTAVVPHGDLLPTARSLAARVLSCGQLAVRLAKGVLDASPDCSRESGSLMESLAQAICFETKDKREGTTAFLERRRPRFTGE